MIMNSIKDILRPVYKKTFVKLKTCLISKIPLKDYIFLEGKPDFQDNARFVFDEMIRRGMNKKYTMLWAVDHPENFKDVRIENTYFIKKESKEWKKLSRRSKALLSCNFVFYKAVKRKDQLTYYLGHGTTFKYVGNRLRMGDATDYINIASEYFKEAELRLSGGGTKERFTYFGLPRNDVFYANQKVDLHKVFSDSDFDTCIMWLPTFRQNITGTRVYSSVSLPVIHSENDAQRLNDYAKKNKTLIVLKPHFNQNMENIKKMNLGNLLIIDDSYFEEKKVLMYQVLAASDAMISDYSSVFWDYLNADKPIGLCWEDFEEFNEKGGFNVDIEPIKNASVLINSMHDFYAFIDSVKNNVDSKRENRMQLKKAAHPNANGTSSKQTVDFIEKKLREL